MRNKCLKRKATKDSTPAPGSELSTEDLNTLASVKQSQHSRICFYPAAWVTDWNLIFLMYPLG